MDNGIDKKALFKFKSEPYLRPISDLKFGFYNLDENTAKLRFQLYNKKGNLLLSENNINAYAYFESANGSATDVEELEIIDELNGIVGITLSKEFLEASTSTKVKGQVYIGVNNVENNPDYNEVAVFREFTFEVKDALINKISSFTKIEYIRMFSQLKLKIEQEVVDIQEAIANGADYVADMKSVLQKGIETLNAIVSNGKTDIQSFINQAKSDLDSTKDNAVNDITTTSNNAKTSVEDTASTAINSINSTADEATEQVDSKVTEFNQTVENNGFLSPQMLDEELGKLEWQKHKLTNDSGNANVITDLDMENIEEKITKAGSYWVTSLKNGPVNINGILLAIHGASDSYKKFIYTPHNSNRVFLKSKNGSVWTGWKEIGNNQSDTGWVTFDLINGATANTEYKTGGDNGFDSAYRTITNGICSVKHLRINGSNLTHGQVIAKLPANFAKNTQTFYVKTDIAHSTLLIKIVPSGEVSIYFPKPTQSEVTSAHGIYGEVSWTD